MCRLIPAVFIVVTGLFCCQCNKKQSPAPVSASFTSTRNQTDFIKIAEEYLKNAEYDSAYRYYSMALVSAGHRQEWEKYFGILLKATDIQRLKGNTDKAQHLTDTAEIILNRHLSGNHQLMADIRHKQGVIAMDRGQFDNAIRLLNESIKIRSANSGNNDTLLAMTYNGLGNVFFYSGDYDRALQSYTRAYELALQRKKPEDEDLSMFVQNIGIIYAQKGDYEKARDFFSNALKINEEIIKPDDPELAMLYLNIGRLLILLNNDAEAIENYNKAEEILLEKAGPDHPDLASLYLNKGQIYVHMADYEKALIFFNKVLAIASEAYEPGHPMILSANMNLGYVYEKKADYNNALKYYQASIPEGENNPSVIKTYSNLASLYNMLGDNEKAMNYYNMTIDRAVKLLGDGHPETGLLYTRYGYFLLNESKGDLGLSMFKKALAISETHYGPVSRETSNNLTHIGNYYLRFNNYKNALRYYQQALNAIIPDFRETSVLASPAENQLISDRYLINALNGKADALYFQALASDNNNMLEKSLSTYKLSVKVVDKLRSGYMNEESKLLLSQDERTTYLNTVRVAAKLYQRTGNKEFLEEAFMYSDKGKSAVLISSMQDVEARQFAGIPRKIQENERNLRLSLGSFNRLVYEERQKTSPDNQKIKFWEDRIFEIETSYDSLISVLEQEYPDYYALKYKEPKPDLQNILQNLENDRTLIEYTLTDTLLYIFVLNKNNFDLITRPIDENFFNHIKIISASTSSSELMSIRKKDYLEYTHAAYSLYRDLLEPVKGIAADKKLIIIPDAEIGFISFDMLLDTPPDTLGMDFRKLPYLIYNHVISYSASAVLQFSKNKKAEKSPKRNLLAVAPSYDNLTNLETDGFIDESGNTVYLLPIPGVENEIRNIRRSIPGNTLAGKKATEREFKKEASEYNILHFAMHTLINNDKPMLSKLVFYQNNDSVEDGMLNTYELFGMQLNARLAVLSACNTGSGKLLKGEGIMSLARGFIYAGVPGIVMTMWSVEDQASAQIVNSFYQYIDKGMPKDEALRQAKLDMLGQGDMLQAHPYYWAAYVTIGDYAPIKLVKSIWMSVFFALIALTSAGLLAAFLFGTGRRHKPVPGI